MTSVQIAVVTRNRASILKDTLSRLSELDLLDNVLIVDGSDNENTKDVCAAFEKISYYEQDSRGMTAARNEALEHSTSSWIAFIDDDVLVSDSWYSAIKKSAKRENVVAVTGKLEDEEIRLKGISKKIRDLLFGSKSKFGEITGSGIINGDFFYDEEKYVDHMPGCNMAYDRAKLEELGGFRKEYDVGNSYREDTVASYQMKKKGKIQYNPEASVNHLKAEENRSSRKWFFYNPYMTKYFLHQKEIVEGVQNRIRYFVNMLSRHIYFGLRCLKNRDPSYLYYLYGELSGFKDFIMLDRKPRNYEM